MNHISVNLAFGRREKKYLGYKSSGGGNKPIRKTEKKMATFFGDSKSFVGAAKKSAGGAKW